MKKYLFYGFILLAILFTPSIVHAEDLRGNISYSTIGMGDTISFQESYNGDFTEIHATVKTNQAVLTNILSQAPGNGGYAGLFYVVVTPNKFRLPAFKMQNEAYPKGTSIDFVKNDLNTKIVDKEVDYSNNPTLWAIAGGISYFKDGAWHNLSEPGNSANPRSNGSWLVEKLGLSNVNQLEYGVNYRIYMYTDYDWYVKYQEEGNEANSDFVKISYDIEFPITANQMNGTAEYYLSLETALASGSNNIVINENTTVSSDIVIPDGVTVTVENGVSLTMGANTKLINHGGLVNYGTIDVSQQAVIEDDGYIENSGSIMGNNPIYTVDTTPDVTPDTTLAEEGETVTLEVAEKDGYEVGSVKLYTDQGDVIEVEKSNGVYSFEMPADNVYIAVEYERIVDYLDSSIGSSLGNLGTDLISESNPNTYDGIFVHYFLGFIGLIGLIGIHFHGFPFFLKKRFRE